MRTPVILIALAAGLLTGCGAEVAGTAATVGKLQAQQARKQQEQITGNLGAALQAGQAAAASAAGQ